MQRAAYAFPDLESVPIGLAEVGVTVVVAAQPFSLGLQLATEWPALLQQRHSLLSKQHLHSLDLSLLSTSRRSAIVLVFSVEEDLPEEGFFWFFWSFGFDCCWLFSFNLLVCWLLEQLSDDVDLWVVFEVELGFDNFLSWLILVCHSQYCWSKMATRSWSFIKELGLPMQAISSFNRSGRPL